MCDLKRWFSNLCDTQVLEDNCLLLGLILCFIVVQGINLKLVDSFALIIKVYVPVAWSCVHCKSGLTSGYCPGHLSYPLMFVCFSKYAQRSPPSLIRVVVSVHLSSSKNIVFSKTLSDANLMITSDWPRPLNLTRY